jgi:hypothetical protein
VLGLSVNVHYVFRAACRRVELNPFPGRSVGPEAREGDEGAVGVGLARDPAFREVHCDIVSNVLPAADRLVSFRDRRFQGGGGRGRDRVRDRAGHDGSRYFFAYGGVGCVRVPPSLLISGHVGEPGRGLRRFHRGVVDVCVGLTRRSDEEPVKLVSRMELVGGRLVDEFSSLVVTVGRP